MVFRGSLLEAALGALFSATVLPYFVLRVLRSRRQRKFGAQFPDALDIIVRSLRAGHPVPIAIAMVGREMPDPIGSEFGIVSDEITYGADLETAMRNLYGRIGSDDLPLFVTAVAIQGATGGNLGEILENLSGVIRQRFKMRRKIRALAAEGRASAMILSALPIGMFIVIQVIAPDFYGSMWHEHLTKVLLVRRRRLDERRQYHHVQDGQLQDLSDGHKLDLCRVRRQRDDDAERADISCHRHARVCGHARHPRSRGGAPPRRARQSSTTMRPATAAVRCAIRACAPRKSWWLTPPSIIRRSTAKT